MTRDTTTRSGSPRVAVTAALLVLAAYGTGLAALLLARHAGTTAAWWPAAGVGLIAALVTPRRHWPVLMTALFAAYALVNVSAGRDLGASSLLGAFDVLETVVMAVLVDRVLPRHRLDSIQDAWKLLGVAAVGALLAALGIAATLDTLIGAPYWSTVAIVAPAHTASVMLIVPLVMIGWRRTPLPAVELTAQVLLLTVATVLAFGPGQTLTLGFAPLPLLVWAAVRFDERVVAVEQVVFAVAVTLGTSIGWGPFNAFGAGDTSTQLSQLYLVCVVLVGLPLVKAMREREEALTRVLASENVFRRNFTQSRVPVALVDWDGSRLRFTECNAATQRLLDRAPEELEGHEVEEYLVVGELLLTLQSTGEGLTGWSGPIGVVADSRTRLDGILSRLEHGEERTRFSLHMTDVTGPLELQASLQAERNYTRAVIDTASSLIVVTDSEGTVIAANPATSQLLGFTEEELTGRRFWDVMIPERLRAGVSHQFSSPRTLPRQGESTVLTKDGHQRTIVFSNSVHQSGPAAPVHLVLTGTDVTDERENAGLVSHMLRSASSIAFIGTDLTGRINLFNTGAEQMLGLPAERAKGRYLVEFLATDEGSSGAPPPPSRSCSPRRAPRWPRRPATGPCSREGRTPMKVSVTSNPVTTALGKHFAYLFVARDVTDTRRSQEILVNALRREREVVARLKDLDRAKDDFVSTVSHELRTPMSSIIGIAEMLADGILGELPPEQRRMVGVISRNGDRLLALADDLLVLATFDHESWPEEAALVDLRTSVQESGEAVASMLHSRDLDVRFSLPEAPVLVRGEANHLERAVTNLMSNAVKFTPDGGRIVVELDVDAAGRSAVLSVADTGLGIPEHDLDRVFGKFYRSAEVQERAIQGSGLGLAIVKTIVESHDGRVGVRSAPDVGTTFTVTLPISRAPGARGRVPAGKRDDIHPICRKPSYSRCDTQHMSTSPRAATARTAALLVVIFAAATTSMLYRPESGAVATWWPAAGLSVGLLVLQPTLVVAGAAGRRRGPDGRRQRARRPPGGRRPAARDRQRQRGPGRRPGPDPRTPGPPPHLRVTRGVLPAPARLGPGRPDDRRGSSRDDAARRCSGTRHGRDRGALPPRRHPGDRPADADEPRAAPGCATGCRSC